VSYKRNTDAALCNETIYDFNILLEIGMQTTLLTTQSSTNHHLLVLSVMLTQLIIRAVLVAHS
jgi:hypothetical protein